MDNTPRDRTEERRDRDNSDAAPATPRKPAPDPSAHVPGSATEMAEINRALQEDTVGKKDRPAKGP